MLRRRLAHLCNTDHMDNNEGFASGMTWTLGDRMFISRERGAYKGMTLEDFAKVIDLSPNTIRSYESDTTIPKTHLLRVWADETGCSLEWLISGTSPNGGSHPELVGRVMDTSPLEITHAGDFARR